MDPPGSQELTQMLQESLQVAPNITLSNGLVLIIDEDSLIVEGKYKFISNVQENDTSRMISSGRALVTRGFALLIECYESQLECHNTLHCKVVSIDGMYFVR